MNENDLTRIRQDLDTIEAAIDLPPASDPREVHINLLFVAAGLAATAWATLPHGWDPSFGLLFFAVPVVRWLSFLRPLPQQPTSAQRELHSARRTLWLFVPLLALFFWCRQIGLTPLHYLSLAIIFVGGVLFLATISGGRGRSFFGWSLALMCGGFTVALEIAPVIAVFGATLGLGGLVSAALAAATRKDSTNHAAS